MFGWQKTASGWNVKKAQKDVDRYTRAAALCLRQATDVAAGDEDILHEIMKVPPFSIRGIDLSSEDGRMDAMEHLTLYCDELDVALEAAGAVVKNWRGAKQLLADAG